MIKAIIAAHFDKLLWAFLAVFFTFELIHVIHRGAPDDKIVDVLAGGITAALGALGILSNSVRNGQPSQPEAEQPKAIQEPK